MRRCLYMWKKKKKKEKARSLMYTGACSALCSFFFPLYLLLLAARASTGYVCSFFFVLALCYKGYI